MTVVATDNKNAKLRFQIRSSESAFSTKWTVFRRNDDVYVTPAGLGATSKISLHASGVCRFAINENLASHSPPMPTSDRVIIKWRRELDLQGIEHTQVMSIAFMFYVPGVSISHKVEKSAVALPAPPINAMTEVCFFYSETDPCEWVSAHWLTRNLLAVWRLESGCYVSIRWRVAPFPPKQMSMLTDAIRNTQVNMVVGVRDPQFVDAGLFDCLQAICVGSTAYISCLLGYSGLAFGRKADWSTRTGHKKFGD